LTDANTSNGSPLFVTQESNGDRLELNIHNDESITPTPPTDDDNNNNNEKQSIATILPIESQLEVQKIVPNPSPPQRKRRKNIPSSKISRPAASSSSSIITNNIKIEKNIPSFNLIRSLLEEKKSDHNDENLLSTIDCLIDSLQHLRERIQTIENNTNEKTSSTINMTNHDDTYPLNLTKPKIRHHSRLASTNSDDMSPSTTTVSSPSTPTLPLSSALYPSQSLYYEKPFFPPFSGKIRSLL
jgi:hypothetical protein